MAVTNLVDDDITVESLWDDPYPIYARLRREAPVCFVPAVGLWFVTRWADVEYGTWHPELFPASVVGSPLDRTLGGTNVLTVDGEAHHERREPLDRALRPKVAEQRAPRSSGPSRTSSSTPSPPAGTRTSSPSTSSPCPHAPCRW